MAGNPNWWSNVHPPQPLFSSQYLNNNSNNNNININVSSNSSLSLDSLADNHHLHSQDPTSQSSWTQFLLSGSISSTTEEDNRKSLEINWEDQMILSSTVINPPPIQKLFGIHDHDHDHEKQEVSISSVTKNNYLYGDHDHEELEANRSGCGSWSKVINQVSSQHNSYITSLGSSCTSTINSNNMLDLISYYNKPDFGSTHTTDDHSTECNSTATGVVSNKKPRVQPSSQPPLKVRKEKLGNRITALHQLVSPFGKTDTASVLFEAIGYIRFLQSQIEAHSSPYLGHASKNISNNNQQYVEVEVGGEKEKPKDLRSRGLCLVPVSCTHHVGSDNGADYWAPSNYPPNGF